MFLLVLEFVKRPGSTRGQNKMKSAADVEAFVDQKQMEIGATLAADE